MNKFQNGVGQKFNRDYYFGKVYSDYDSFLEWDERAAELIKRYQCRSFLDVGCGCGNLVKEVKQQAENKWSMACDVCGVDSSEFAIKRADTPLVSWADCRELPFADNQFEVVYVLTTFSYLHGMADIKQAVVEAYRVANKTIVFDDVYNWPEKTSFDYDPYRTTVLSQEKWMEVWRQVIDGSDRIETRGDEIIITRQDHGQ